jgi:hypothetical protein
MNELVECVGSIYHMTDVPGLWQRALPGPILRPRPGGLLSEAVTTPDVLVWNDRLYLYVGAVSGKRERIVALQLKPDWLRAGKSIPLPDEVSVAVDVGPQRFDSQHVFDPATVAVGGQVFLYYSAIGPDADTLGLAISDNGVSFRKRKTPVLAGRSPEVIWSAGRFHLFYVREMPAKGFAIFSATSEDGETFSPVSRGPVLYAGESGTWDGFEVTTPRLFERGGVFYMLYAGEGDPARVDNPSAFGLARSYDLLTWERYPGNPVFHRGMPGEWDDGSIWFGTVFDWDDTLYLMYEGGIEADINRAGPMLTQVGLAMVDGATFDQHVADW